ALAALTVRGQSMLVAVIQGGRLADAIDVRAFVRAKDAAGELTPVDELHAELKDDEPWHVGASGARPESKLVGLELDEHALLSALPPLEPPLLGHGRRTLVAVDPGEARALVLEAARQLGCGKRGVTYGYADLANEFVSRERFVDPDPPALDDVDAWLEQCPSAR